MAFTEEEIAKIEKWGKKEPLIKKMWDEISICNEDVSKRFCKVINETAKILTDDIDNSNSSKSRLNKYLSADTKTYRRIYELVSNSKKIIDGLERSKAILTGGTSSISTGGARSAELQEDEEISYTDRKADEKQIKK